MKRCRNLYNLTKGKLLNAMQDGKYPREFINFANYSKEVLTYKAISSGIGVGSKRTTIK